MNLGTLKIWQIRKISSHALFGSRYVCADHIFCEPERLMILKMSRAAVRKEKTPKKGKDQIKEREVKKKPKLKEKVTEILELPKEIVLNMPKLTMLGNGDLIVENYKGIVEYDEGIIRLNTTSGIIKVTGINILIKEITLESIMIFGDIKSLEFLNNE